VKIGTRIVPSGESRQRPGVWIKCNTSVVPLPELIILNDGRQRVRFSLLGPGGGVLFRFHFLHFPARPPAKNSQGNESDATLKAQEVMLHRKEIETYSAQIAKLEPSVEEAKNIATTFQKQIKELQVKKEMNVKDLELNIQNKVLYDSLDELRHSKPINNLLKSVEEGVVEKRELAVGAKEVHENKLSTKLERIDAKVQDAETDNYLASLREKYKK
jgi:hypothetical protein